MASFGFVQVRGRGQNSDAFTNQVIENTPEVSTRNRVNTVRGFVEKDCFGAVDQRVHKPQFLFHAPGKLSCKPCAKLKHSCGTKELRFALVPLPLVHAA